MLDVMSVNEPERPAEGWKYAYAASAVDFGSNLKVVVQKATDRAVGYAIIPSLTITNSNQAAIGFLDEFCEQHGLDPNLRSDKGRRRLPSKDSTS
jgi:transposase-like protein